MRHGQNGCHFANNIFKYIFLGIFIEISMKFVSEGPIYKLLQVSISWVNGVSPNLALKQCWRWPMAPTQQMSQWVSEWLRLMAFFRQQRFLLLGDTKPRLGPMLTYLLIDALETNFKGNLNRNTKLSTKHEKMSAAWELFCSGLNVLNCFLMRNIYWKVGVRQ